MKKTGLIIMLIVAYVAAYGQYNLSLSYNLDSTENEIINIYSKVNKSLYSVPYFLCR